MQLRRLAEDERGANAVIAVMILAVLVVLLMGSVGSFVLNLGQENTEKGPTVRITLEASTGYTDTGVYGGAPGSGEPGITLSHEGGDSLDVSTIQIIVDGERLLTDDGDIAGNQAVYDASHPDATTPGDEWASGESYTIVANDESPTDPVPITDGATVRVVWHSSNTDKSETLFRGTIEL